MLVSVTIFLSDIAKELHCEHAEFADDFTLWKTISDDDDLEAIKHDLKLIEEWSSKWRISFGEKCSHTIFKTRNKRDFPKANFNFNGIPLREEKFPKLLGLTFDPELSFSKHINVLVTKLKQKVGIFYKIISSKLGSITSALIKGLFISSPESRVPSPGTRLFISSPTGTRGVYFESRLQELAS